MLSFYIIFTLKAAEIHHIIMWKFQLFTDTTRYTEKRSEKWTNGGTSVIAEPLLYKKKTPHHL